MGPKISVQTRAEAVARYRQSDMTQQEFCAEFEARTGRRLSPRTLRSWLAAAGPVATQLDPDAARMNRAIRQVRDLLAEIEAMLADLSEAGADSARPLPQVPSAESLPQPAGPAETMRIATVPSPELAAAAMPTAKKEHTTSARAPDRYDFWS